MIPLQDNKSTRRELALIRFLPNALTLAAICAGLTAIRLAAFGSVKEAVALVLLAALIDGTDGRLARRLKSESQIGAELDSLADFVNFGVAPAIILYFHGMYDHPHLGWVAALAYAITCVLRLARFNVASRQEVAADKRFFTGVPAPVGAMLAFAPLFLDMASDGALAVPAALAAIWLVLVGGLMVSRLPTFSLKATVYADHARLVQILVAACVISIAIFPWSTLLLVDVAYLGSIILSIQARRLGNRRA